MSTNVPSDRPMPPRVTPLSREAPSRLAGPPAPLDPLIGRAHEVAALTALLRAGDARLITLTGPGGVGKTRLGIEAASLVAAEFEGVAFVSLAAVAEPALVAPAIAQAIGVRNPGDRRLGDLLRTALHGRRLLIVLDNFEHLLPAATVVGELLAACPSLVALVTSRARLRLSGERRFPVSPLALPDLPAAHSAAAIATNAEPPGELGVDPAVAERIRATAAVQLFVARAQALAPDFVLADDETPAVAAICHRLDGLPLAIELAAARSQLLSPAALLARLAPRLNLLADGPRDAPARLRTMRDAIAWSYDLLDPQDQRCYCCLAVFTGGFALDGAERVCGATLERVGALVDQSLVRPQATGGGDAAPAASRFAMLETIREFALERLAERGEEDDARDRHAGHCLALAEAAEPHLRRPEQAAWFDRLETEHPNLRAALGWYRDRKETERALRLAGALGRFWRVRGHLAEGADWLLALLAAAERHPTAAPSAVRAKAQSWAGSIVYLQGRLREATDHHTAALRLYEEAGDAWGAAFSVQSLGVQAVLQTDFARATTLYEEALDRFRAIGDDWGIGATLMNYGCLVGDAGDLDRSEQLLTESLAPMRRAGDPDRLAVALVNLAEVACDRGNDAEAERLLGEGLALLRPIGQQEVIAYALGLLGLIAWRRGDAASAHGSLTESLALCRDIGTQHWTARTLEALAKVAVAGGRAAPAVRLLGAASALRETTGAPGPPAERADVDTTAATARGALGEAAFAAAWAEGRAAPGATIAAALAETATPPVATPPAPGAGQASPPPPGLTRRELDVLRLLVEGRTDREAAAALSISPRTVESHVVRLLAKLGQPSRTAAVAYAVRHGLA